MRDNEQRRDSDRMNESPCSDVKRINFLTNYSDALANGKRADSQNSNGTNAEIGKICILNYFT